MIPIILFMFGALFFSKLEPALERMRSFTIEWYVYIYITITQLAKDSEAEWS